MPITPAEINAKNKAFNTYDRKGRRATLALYAMDNEPKFRVGQKVRILRTTAGFKPSTEYGIVKKVEKKLMSENYHYLVYGAEPGANWVGDYYDESQLSAA